MGDMADFAIEEVMVSESMRDSYYTFSEMSNEEAFDIGFIDPLGAETSYLTGDRVRGKPRCKKTVSQLIASTEKYDERVSTTKWMLKGFADFYNDRGFLSAKQKAIIETNFHGGANMFIATLDAKRRKY